MSRQGGHASTKRPYAVEQVAYSVGDGRGRGRPDGWRRIADKKMPPCPASSPLPARRHATRPTRSLFRSVAARTPPKARLQAMFPLTVVRQQWSPRRPAAPVPADSELAGWQAFVAAAAGEENGRRQRWLKRKGASEVGVAANVAARR